ncbi:beta-galactosidase 13-like [Impatiens glandulifera]|uniref:beta-galactosidase 13-like n=1 Tax=Impatiens glandulifera TaxID=253017 RepID=UPI001FB09BFE|nr:beta-galactosidase 13-like [Impatiens glandulifera]
MTTTTVSKRILVVTVLYLLVNSVVGGADRKKRIITYDGRSLIIDGARELLFSGSIHYTRSPPELWPEIIRRSKAGGLNVIQTYIFWNVHEPIKGQWNFEGNNDVIKFLRIIQDQGMYVTLRIGPFIEAEWNHGGFPYWMREFPGIIFRSDNEPFKREMESYCRKVIDMMVKENMFAPQGGPIIMAQIENEYNNVQLAYREKGASYIQWAANLALSFNVGVPWIMCKQKDAPGAVINTCNGRQCGDTFTGPNSPNKPSLWTENWTAQYRVFGDPPSQRAAEDIAYQVARFFSKNGTLTNYYMYHGGTNFGRTTSTFVTTRYYDEAPLDEFGLPREPKYGHLRDLHRALKLSKKALLWGTPTAPVRTTGNVEIRTYEKPGTTICTAFLNNNNTKAGVKVNFRGKDFFLPPRSISILPDCKTVVYNSQTIVSQHNSRKFHPSAKGNKFEWTMSKESIPDMSQMPIKNRVPLEQYVTAKDTTDYMWYSTSISFDAQDLSMRDDIIPVLQVANLGHAMVAFVNGEYIGFLHGSNVEKSFVFRKPINLKPGNNHISILSITIGMVDAGAYMEKRYCGVRAVTIQGLNAGTLDITPNNWGHQVGISGEKNQVYTENGSSKFQWTSAKGIGGPITWYKTYFDTPEGNSPVAVRMGKMGKGMIWINGINIGRYWMNYLSPLGQPTQTEYHIPRAYLKPDKNLMVVFEEVGGDPSGIEMMIVNRDTICSYITENHPPSVDSWKKVGGSDMQTTVEDLKTGAHLFCTEGKVIKKVEFASFGNPGGSCGAFIQGTCHAPSSQSVAEKNCLGKKSCAVPLDRTIFEGKGGDNCGGISKVLAVQVRCGHEKSSD